VRCVDADEEQDQGYHGFRFAGLGGFGVGFTFSSSKAPRVAAIHLPPLMPLPVREGKLRSVPLRDKGVSTAGARRGGFAGARRSRRPIDRTGC
jgi:hypothetical protein